MLHLVMNLRGGGGGNDTITLINKKDTITLIDKKDPTNTFTFTVETGKHNPAIFIQKFVEKLGRPSKEFKIQFVDMDSSGSKTLYFEQTATFKEIVFSQKSDGEWSTKLLSHLDTTIDALRAKHTSPQSLSNLTDGQVLTLVGIYVLQKHFANDRKLWKLVVDKAKRKLTGQGIQIEEIDRFVNKFEIEMPSF